MNEKQAARYQQLKDFVTGCHSALDAESRVYLFLDSCLRRNDFMYTQTLMQSIEDFFD